MDAGDCFRVSSPGTTLDTHLWMVISDPAQDPERVLIVNLTSWNDRQDRSCVVEVGEHPFVHHRSCVRYSGAKVVRVDQLDALKRNGSLLPLAPISRRLLKRVRLGAERSPHTELGHIEILRAQGLIDPEG